MKIAMSLFERHQQALSQSRLVWLKFQRQIDALARLLEDCLLHLFFWHSRASVIY